MIKVNNFYKSIWFKYGYGFTNVQCIDQKLMIEIKYF
jgi:hypothetical protein